jgi:hypothetical protein
MLRFASLIAVALVLAQGAGAQTKQAPQPPLLECGKHPPLEVFCGTRSPEDLELTPDNKFLITGQFIRNSPESGMALFDLTTKTFSRITPTVEPRKDWGDPSCPGPVDRMIPHGISLMKRTDGAMELYVVNHGGRESMEMFELKSTGVSWGLVWHGCVVATSGYNDVAAIPDGSFVATHPTALVPPGKNSADLGDQPTGFVGIWRPGKSEEELPGTRVAYPNGILISADGRYMYLNVFRAREIHKYDMAEHKDIGKVKVDFMPDNITWTKNHEMLAAGIKDSRWECPAGSGVPCQQMFGVARINPAKMTAVAVYDSVGKPASIAGVSSALEVGRSIYLGAFQGDRIVKLDLH